MSWVILLSHSQYSDFIVAPAPCVGGPSAQRCCACICGIRVIVFAMAQIGAALLRSERGPDLILMDIMMSHVHGDDVGAAAHVMSFQRVSALNVFALLRSAGVLLASQQRVCTGMPGAAFAGHRHPYSCVHGQRDGGRCPALQVRRIHGTASEALPNEGTFRLAAPRPAQICSKADRLGDAAGREAHRQCILDLAMAGFERRRGGCLCACACSARRH